MCCSCWLNSCSRTIWSWSIISDNFLSFSWKLSPERACWSTAALSSDPKLSPFSLKKRRRKIRYINPGEKKNYTRNKYLKKKENQRSVRGEMKTKSEGKCIICMHRREWPFKENVQLVNVWPNAVKTCTCFSYLLFQCLCPGPFFFPLPVEKMSRTGIWFYDVMKFLR